MNITVSSFISEGSKKNRLFKIFFHAKDTLRILEAPGGLYMTEQKTHAQFCIWHKPHIDEQSIFFEFRDDCYNFISKTGFKTDEEHLNWLISLGRIPMGQNVTTFGKVNFVIMGYVQFMDEQLFSSEPPKEKPLEEHFLRKLMSL